MKSDPSDHVLPCNRAMARLKLEQWKLAEQDGSRSLNLLPTPNCKAHFRRGLARKGMKRWAEAKQDFEAAYTIEPSNASIATELAFVKSQLEPTATDPDPSSRGKVVGPSSNPTPSSLSSSSSCPPISVTSTSLDEPSTSSISQTSALLGQSTQILNGDSPGLNLIREVSTRRFDPSKKSEKASETPTSTLNSFSTLKDIRKKKENGGYSFTKRDDANVSFTASSSPKATKTSLPMVRDDIRTTSQTAFPPSSPVYSFSELERQWGMSARPDARWCILKGIHAAHLPTIFGEHLEPNFLDQMIEAFEVPQRSGTQPDLAQAARLIEGLNGVSRLKTLTMFLTSEQKEVIKELLARYESIGPEKQNISLSNWDL
ncbi:uncharacterized protein MELLADRAFT_68599 [Melampsora larici-populina 98AG31]|uniref:RNA polymerase II-associated protein 3 n=1 Tax=Melampsora larici-populina (strain 98AG31 / pathotype 3-4-7) TaxID=747676 RepID=F4S7E1_MELLP|nr:uncharacterized protein MELLADRAFT_68599 [Melampsora larici-populina 98AG31]EGF99390.1 hypothetical protein MELLADRAFT_68599 [Melampsora larici-populina 98AG31]